MTVDDVSYTYTDGTLRYEVLPERPMTRPPVRRARLKSPCSWMTVTEGGTDGQSAGHQHGPDGGR